MLLSPWAFPIKALSFTAWSYCIICHSPAKPDYTCPRPSRMRSDSAHIISNHISCSLQDSCAKQHSNFCDVLKQQLGVHVLIIWFPFSFGCCNGAHWSMLQWSRLSAQLKMPVQPLITTNPYNCTEGRTVSCTPSQGSWIQFTKCYTISLFWPIKHIFVSS